MRKPDAGERLLYDTKEGERWRRRKGRDGGGGRGEEEEKEWER